MSSTGPKKTRIVHRMNWSALANVWPMLPINAFRKSATARKLMKRFVLRHGGRGRRLMS